MTSIEVGAIGGVAPLVDEPPRVPPPSQAFAFHGTGGAFFALILKNVLLTMLSLGVYSAWAKTERRKFLWQNTELMGQRFVYLGTGRELFGGYVKVGLGYLAFIAVPGLASLVSEQLALVARLVLAVAFVVLVPFAIDWSRSYLLSRTSWRGVRFGLSPGAGEYAKVFFLGALLTLLSLGLYAPVWLNRLHASAMNRTRFGDTAFHYDGADARVWVIMIKGWVLSALTLGIYYPWYRAELLRYRLEHTRFDGARFRTTLTGADLFGLGLVYVLGTTFTFGIAFPWVACHVLQRTFERLQLEGSVDFARIAQAPQRGDAMGDGLAEAMDVGLPL